VFADASRLFKSFQKKHLLRNTLDKSQNYYIISDDLKYIIISLISCCVLLSSFLFNDFQEIFSGMKKIAAAPSILVTDYMEVANIGSAFFNSGLLMITGVLISKISKIQMNGPLISAIFTIGGFALFGKNIYNIWAIIAGVYLYSFYQKEKFSKFILIALFGTALGPLVSQISFGFDIPMPYSIVLANMIGLAAGFCLPSLANHFVLFHQGFNLYNIGFTAGITGMVFMAIFRAFDFDTDSQMLIVSNGNNQILSIYLIVMFSIMMLIGLFYSNHVFTGLLRIWDKSGRLVSDFVSSNGFGPSMVNMSLLGLISTGYVFFVGGDLTGPTIGGIFTIVGFGAFGKHVKNVVPILLGVYLASLLKLWEPNSMGAMLAALFGTTLAPISGTYGWKYGIIAGFVHMSMVMNVGYLHGGMNLYNNGFSGGFVAAVLVPVFDSIKKNYKVS